MTTLTTDTITIEITRGVQRSETQWVVQSATHATFNDPIRRVLNPDNQWGNRGGSLYRELKEDGKMSVSIEEAEVIATKLESEAATNHWDMTPRRRTGALRAAKTIREAIATS